MNSKKKYILLINHSYLYETVLKKVSTWGTQENLMFVIGATQADEFINIES